jgi:hypothetical protein
MSDPREARLPKWAQEELRSLRKKLGTTQRKLEESHGNIPDTDTYLLDYGSLTDWPLPRGARVAFHLTPQGHERKVRQAIQVYASDGALRIQGDTSLVVFPRASNSFNIELERYR